MEGEPEELKGKRLKDNTGWWYQNADGSMATNKWIGNYYVDANGAWVPGKTR